MQVDERQTPIDTAAAAAPAVATKATFGLLNVSLSARKLHPRKSSTGLNVVAGCTPCKSRARTNLAAMLGGWQA